MCPWQCHEEPEPAKFLRGTSKNLERNGKFLEYFLLETMYQKRMCERATGAQTTHQSELSLRQLIKLRSRCVAL